MSKGIGSKEVRKLQLTGGSTYTLSLPKYWIDVNKLTTSDGIEVDWRPSGALRLTPATGVNEIRRRSIVIQDDHALIVAIYNSVVLCVIPHSFTSFMSLTISCFSRAVVERSYLLVNLMSDTLHFAEWIVSLLSMKGISPSSSSV